LPLYTFSDINKPKRTKKTQKITKCCFGYGGIGTLYIAGGNVKWGTCVENILVVPQKITELPYDSAILP